MWPFVISKYTAQPLSEKEQAKVEKMRANGTSWEGAMKTRFALRRKRRVLVVE
jgi:hypothetical protein